MKFNPFIALSAIILFSACTRTIKVKNLQESEPLLVVEGYINQQYPQLNYVILTKGVTFQDENTKPQWISGAEVFVTEGAQNADGTYNWDATTRTKWKELQGQSWIPAGQLGVYADSAFEMLGKEGKFYRLEINYLSKSYSAITEIPKVVPIDSMTYQIVTNPINDKIYGQVIVNYNEPKELGNNYFSLYDSAGAVPLKGWGGTLKQRVADDHTINGVYRNELRFTRFSIGDTVNYYLNTIDRNSFNFWQTQISNSGTPNPFTSGAPQPSNIKGENCTGNFTGMGVSHASAIIKN